jgi:hypothetical protein
MDLPSPSGAFLSSERARDQKGELSRLIDEFAALVRPEERVDGLTKLGARL